MSKTICGIDCKECGFYLGECKGCFETEGKPFGGDCIIAKCVKKSGLNECTFCEKNCELKKKLIDEVNSLQIPGLFVENIYALVGSYVNLEYTLASGQKIKFWDDKKLYLGAQITISNKKRCYGITADEDYLLICEYNEGGKNPEIVLYRKRSL